MCVSVYVCERRELCPCEQACSLNLLGSIPARCLNVDRVALKAGKWIFCPELFPSGFSFSVSNSLNHLCSSTCLLCILSFIFRLVSLSFLQFVFFPSFRLLFISSQNKTRHFVQMSRSRHHTGWVPGLYPVSPHCSTGAQ